MSDVHAYRASDELAAGLREHDAADAEFRSRVMAWDAEHPDHHSRWARSPFGADMHFMGFYDGTDEVPAGLSRAKARESLRAKRGPDGQAWREVEQWMSKRPLIERVLRDFEIPDGVKAPGPRDGSFVCRPTQWLDAGADGVLVTCLGDLTTGARMGHTAGVGVHLTAVPLSEFYAIKERLEGEQDQAVAS